MSSEASTPLMRQYHSVKQQVPNALLMFRLGDFYELFYDDAVIAARDLEITLTSRNKEKGQAIPMCGVPFHAAEGYIARLIQKGHRVAICDQVEDPRFAKKLVKRELARIVTPGTVTESNLLRARENNYLAAVASDSDKAGLATSLLRARLDSLLPGQLRSFAETDSAAASPAARELTGGLPCSVKVACALSVARTQGARWVVLTKVSKTSNLIWVLSAQLIRVADGAIILDDSTELKGEPEAMIRVGMRSFATRVVRTVRAGGVATNFPS